MDVAAGETEKLSELESPETPIAPKIEAESQETETIPQEEAESITN